MLKSNAMELSEELVTKLGKGILLTTGNKDKKNVMTISWGTIGNLWGREVVFVFVRPSRYSFNILEETERFTLSYLPSKYNKEIATCGKISGRDQDKFVETNLTPIYDVDQDIYYVKEAELVLKIKKLAFFDMNESNLLDEEIVSKFYAKGDYHRIYVGEITSCLTKEKE